MTRLFGVDIAAELNKAMGKGLLPLQLLKAIPGTRSAANPTAGTNPTSRTYSCRGFTDDYSDGEYDGTTIMHGDRKVLILGASLPAGIVPKPGDSVVVPNESTYTIVGPVKRDPASATYTCQGRGA